MYRNDCIWHSIAIFLVFKVCDQRHIEYTKLFPHLNLGFRHIIFIDLSFLFITISYYETYLYIVYAVLHCIIFKTDRVENNNRLLSAAAIVKRRDSETSLGCLYLHKMLLVI